MGYATTFGTLGEGADRDDWDVPRGDSEEKTPQGQESAKDRDLLPLYLREMGSVPLLDRDQEYELARRYHDAREALVAIARSLPENVREVVLGARRRRLESDSHWMMDDVRCFVERLELHVDLLGERRAKGVLERAARAKAELDAARDALIVANLRLVVHMAKRFTRAGLSFLDLIQEGNIGLMKAVEKFEHERGNKFSTYAYWWIKQAMDRAIAEKARMIRIPVNLNETRKRMRRTMRSLGQTLGREPTPVEIARAMKVPREKIEQVLNLVRDPQSFEFQPGKGDDPAVMQIADPAEHSSALATLEGREVKTEIERALESLPPREERILRLRYGVGGEGPYTLEEIGFFMNLSRERVRQLEYLGLRSLRGSGVLAELVRGDRGE